MTKHKNTESALYNDKYDAMHKLDNYVFVKHVMCNMHTNM